MTPSPTALEEITRSYLDLRWHMDPVDATSAGVTEHDERLGNFGEEDVSENVAALQSVANALEELELDSLDDEIDRTALLNEIRMTVHRFTVEQPQVTNPNFWISHLLEGLYLLLAREDRPRDHRARAAACRLELIPPFLQRAEETLTGCPAVFAETAGRVVEGGIALIDRIEEELPSDRAGFEDVAREAREALAGFGRSLPAGVLDDADFAIGETAFNYRLQVEHALAATASEAHTYGEWLVEAVRRDLEALAEEIDGSTDWPALMHRLRDEHPAADGLVDSYATEMERARTFVEERGLIAVPDGDLRVIETPSFLVPVIPFAAYQPPGAFAGDRTGLFYVTRPGAELEEDEQDALLRDHCYHDLASTSLHEGYPGHHLQFLTAQAQERTVRKLMGTPVNYEGWALYCEDMMGEQGFYRTVEERFFQKVALLWRAARVVLDVGLHTRGLQIDDAISWLVELVAFDRRSAEAEVRRYCETPGYQLSYAVGRREMKALRHDFERASGADYTPRAFHDRVMVYGGLPVSMMRWGMGL